MHPQPYEPPVKIRPTEVDAIALADLAEAKRRGLQRDRLISHGFVRGDTPTAAGSAR